MFDTVDLTKWVWAILALLLMFGGLFGVLHALRRYGTAKWQTRTKNTDTPKRLKIVDSLNLDLRRSIILVDDGIEEHTILLSPQAETLISSKKKL